MKMIVKLQDIRFASFPIKGGTTEGHFARMRGVDALGKKTLPAVAWNTDAIKINREINGLLPEGMEVSDLNLFVELTGEQQVKVFTKNGREFSKTEFKVAKDGARILTGPGAELQAARFDATAAAVGAEALAHEGRPEEAYALLAKFAATFARLDREPTNTDEDDEVLEEMADLSPSRDGVAGGVDPAPEVAIAEAIAGTDAQITPPDVVTPAEVPEVQPEVLANSAVQVEMTAAPAVESAPEAEIPALDTAVDTAVVASPEMAVVDPEIVAATADLPVVVQITEAVHAAPTVSTPVAAVVAAPVRSSGFGNSRPVAAPKGPVVANTPATAAASDTPSTPQPEARSAIGRRGSSMSYDDEGGGIVLPEDPEQAAQAAYISRGLSPVAAAPKVEVPATAPVPTPEPVKVATVARVGGRPMGGFGFSRPAAAPAPSASAPRM